MYARGFTLIELTMTIVILGIVAAVGAPMLANGLQMFQAATVELNTLSKERYAMARMARELRAANFNSGTSQYDVTLASAGASGISFTKTDGVTVTLTGAPPLLQITYSSGGGAATLTDQVAAAGVAFTGYAADGATTTVDAAQIKYVDVSLSVLRPPANTISFPRVTRVQLRDQQ